MELAAESVEEGAERSAVVVDDGGHGRHAGDDEADVHLDDGHDEERDDVPGDVGGVLVEDAQPQRDAADYTCEEAGHEDGGDADFLARGQLQRPDGRDGDEEEVKVAEDVGHTLGDAVAGELHAARCHRSCEVVLPWRRTAEDECDDHAGEVEEAGDGDARVNEVSQPAEAAEQVEE